MPEHGDLPPGPMYLEGLVLKVEGLCLAFFEGKSTQEWLSTPFFLGTPLTCKVFQVGKAVAVTCQSVLESELPESRNWV